MSIFQAIAAIPKCSCTILKYPEKNNDATIFRLSLNSTPSVQLSIKVHLDIFPVAKRNYQLSCNALNSSQATSVVHHHFVVRSKESVHYRVCIYDFLSGSSLRIALSEGQLSESRAFTILSRTAHALYRVDYGLIENFDFTDCIFTTEETIIITDWNKLDFIKPNQHDLENLYLDLFKLFKRETAWIKQIVKHS